MCNGKGHLVSADGTTYEGNWNGGVAHGYGKKIWSDGDQYEGYY